MKKKIIICIACAVLVVIALVVCIFVLKKTNILSGEDKTAATQENIQGEQEDENAVRSTEDAGEDPGENVVKKEDESADTATGSSQDHAILLPLGTKVYGTVRDDETVWFSFTTGSESGTTYNITVINGTPDGEDLQIRLYDEYGTRMEANVARPDGVPGTISVDYLEPDTVYYASVKAAFPETVEYSLQVKDPEKADQAYKTMGTLREAVGTSVKEDGTVSAGTSPNNAALIPIGTKAEGTVRQESYAWFEFITDADADEVYKISVVNKSQGGDMQAWLYDEYGTRLEAVGVRENGETETISAEGLKPETAYYIRLNPALTGTLDYSLVIQTSEEEQQKNAFVFETPFEINETQVQFVPDTDEFIDRAKAEEVLKPVAEAILAAPDHSVMIAGTTATYGDQASSVDLSEKRAEAVKELLINTYDVPESQLKSIGLGYEQDPFTRGKDIDGNGNFVESEAKKNRRVVILDAEDPIAQELLEKQ